MTTRVERIFRNVKIVIPWYATTGSTDTVQYELRNVREYKKLLFKVTINRIEKCVFFQCSPIDKLVYPVKFTIVVNDKYRAEASKHGLEVGDIIEIDGTNTILPYITDGRNNFKLEVEVQFVHFMPVHEGLHIYADVDMIIEDSSIQVRRVGLVIPLEQFILKSLIDLITPLLPLIMTFFIVYILIKIIVRL